MTTDERIEQMRYAGRANKYSKTTVARLIEHYNTAMQGKSRKTGIAAFCCECMGWDAGLTENIRGCTDVGCPLYPYRPYR